MTSSPDFSGAYAKLAWANKHVSHLEETIGRYLMTDFYTIRLEGDQATGSIRVSLDSFHEPSEEVNLILGDAVGNLRSVLDYIAVAITGHQKAAFPFADNENGFKGEVKKGFIGRHCGAEVVEFFINEIKAYPRAQSTLWSLNKLRNIDKHRTLVTTAEFAGVKLSFQTGMSTHIDEMFYVKPGHSMAIVDAAADQFKITNKPAALFDVRLKEPGAGAPNESVVEFTKLAAQSVDRCLRTIEKIFT